MKTTPQMKFIQLMKLFEREKKQRLTFHFFFRYFYRLFTTNSIRRSPIIKVLYDTITEESLCIDTEKTKTK